MWQKVANSSQGKLMASIYTNLFLGSIKLRGKQIPRATVMGIVGVAFMYVAAAGAVSITTPWWLGQGDAPRHIDYAYSVYNLDIPQFNDRLIYPAFNELREGKYGNQPAAINPPLFYILHAPVIGPFFASGNWQEGIAAGRALNILLGIVCILTLAWGGWLFGGNNKGLMAVATPAMGVLMFNFLVLNQNYAVDVLLIIFTTLALILSYKMIDKGFNKKYFILLLLLSVAGMATKATYIVFLAASLMAVAIAIMMRSLDSFNNARKGLIRVLIVLAIVLMTVTLTIGWYYYFQNYQLSGSWVSAAPPDYGSSSRPYKSFSEVMTSMNLWGMLYANYASLAVLSIVMTTVAACGVAFIFDRSKIKSVLRNRSLVLGVLVMLAAYVGIFMTQISHAVGYGGYYFRYFLPALLPISLFFAYGLTAIKWTRGLLIPIFGVLLAITSVASVLNQSVIEGIIKNINSTDIETERLFIAASHNGIPEAIPASLLTLIVLGVILLAVSVVTLTRKTTRPRS